jgi:hypothetical protein
MIYASDLSGLPLQNRLNARFQAGVDVLPLERLGHNKVQGVDQINETIDWKPFCRNRKKETTPQRGHFDPSKESLCSEKGHRLRRLSRKRASERKKVEYDVIGDGILLAHPKDM